MSIIIIVIKFISVIIIIITIITIIEWKKREDIVQNQVYSINFLHGLNRRLFTLRNTAGAGFQTPEGSLGRALELTQQHLTGAFHVGNEWDWGLLGLSLTIIMNHSLIPY